MSTKPSRTQRTRRKPPRQAMELAITIRMYDVGFGDCFMLCIPKPDGTRIKVLFDCGSIKQGVSAIPMKKVVQQVIDDARDAPGSQARIDVIVATHRHKDHISGFDDPAWNEVEVGEVWMPWTEKPNDLAARQIREAQSRLAAQLESRLQARLAAISSDPMEHLLLESGHEMALNALSNEGAMRTLYQGFAGNPIRRYLPDESASAVAWFNTPVLPGVTIHVLGPSRDEDIIRELDPPAGQSYLKLLETGHSSVEGKARPFGMDWVVTIPEYDLAYYALAQALPPEDREGIKLVGRDLDGAVALALDKALNGTSLVLIFQIGRATLLFPGDAQWGTWRVAMDNADFRKLLGEANFYKVGHHGSHNATPVEFVKNIMGKNVHAMVSINPTANWPMIPKPELIQALNEKEGCKIARSDQADEAKKQGFSVDKKGVIEVSIPF